MIIMILLLSFFANLAAPPNNSIVIFEAKAVNPYNAILKACIQIESSGNRFAYNSKELAVGILQITPVRLLDFNRNTGKHYTQNDCYSIEVSKEIFFHYISKCDYRDIKSMAVAWNGVSVRNKYYAKVKKLL